MTRMGLATLAGLAAIVLGSTAGRGQEAVSRTVVISIDGLSPSAYAEASGGDMPTLRRLAAEGARASGVVGVFPTVTYPSHTTMITGVPPAVHGIYNNRMLDPEGRSNGAWYWYARDIKTRTLVEAVREAGRHAAAIYWPVTVGMDIDVLLPEFSRSAHPENLSLLRALSRPSTLIDDLEAERGRALPSPLDDAARAEMAAWVFRVHQPHLLLLHIFETDTIQHVYGPGSPQARTARVEADRNLAVVLDAIDDTGLGDRTNIVVVSDHGFLPVGRQLQVNAVFKEEGWLRVDARGRVTDWDAYFQPSGGSAFVFLDDGAGEDLRERVSGVLEELARDPANGIERILDGDELRALGADPRAAFAIDMRSGFYTGAAHDRLLGEPPGKGGHGFHPSRPELHASLVMRGPDVPWSGDLGIVRMTQIAPTIARWFGVGLSREADVPLALNPVTEP